MAESAQKVLHELTAAGLLSSDRATDFGEEISTGAEALLARLVKEGHITQFQAQKFLDGQSSDIYFGDYIVLDKLGQGGMGTVLLAKHKRMDRQVAIKILPVTALDSEASVARFYQEVKVAAQLTHPNIVHAYDAGEHHGFHYLVMEYVAGHDLAQVLTQLGMIPPMLAIDYLTQVTAGLEYAHRKGIIHRDIKPSNLLLDDEGNVKILDMGLARIGGAFDAETSAHLTTTGQMMGTVEYMSPEQAEDTRTADARSDIYSLGCTLYRLVTGSGPFTRDTVVKTILAHRDSEIPVVTTGFMEDKAINRLLQKMMAKNPDDRFQSTTLLMEALRRFSSGDELSDIQVAPQNTSPLGFNSSNPSDSTNTDSPSTSIPQPGAVQPSAPVAGNTAIAYRVGGGESDSGTIPEAIIPGLDADSKPSHFEPTIDSNSGIGQGQQAANSSAAFGPGEPVVPEIVYIKDEAPLARVRGFFGKVFRWLRANPSATILIRGIVCIVTIPWLSIILGPLTWLAARKRLRLIERGEMAFQEHSRWMLIIGKWLAIISIPLTVIAWIGIANS